jgi:hypothetical protein
MSAAPAKDYILGHDEREHHRLSAQASLRNPSTEQFLSRAGAAFARKP